MSFVAFWVTPHLGFASEPEGSADARRLVALGVTDVLDLRAEATDQSAVYRPYGIHYLRDPMIDDGRHQPTNLYVTGVSFVKQALARGGKVLIHCAAGQYRSPSMVYAVLRAMGYGQRDAWNMILRARGNANRQYVDDAEQAVPYLPRITPGGRPPQADHPVMFAASLLAVGAGSWWAANKYLHSAARRHGHAGR